MRDHALKIAAVTAVALASCAGASAQSQNPACQRLEAQLTALERGNDDPARGEQIKRAEDAVNRQQAEVDRLVAQSRRLGCEGFGFFSIFNSPSAQCTPLTNQIQQARGNLERTQNQLERMHGGNTERAAQRRSLYVALGDAGCGPQYRQAATQQGGGFFDQVFGNRGTSTFSAGDLSGNFRTICVRTCDGFYFPISFSVPSAKFQDDARICQRMCPASEVALYTFHNPGEDVNQAVSLDGRPYTELPAAFRYRTEVNPACSCRQQGQSWADAMKTGGPDQIEQGDVVVTEDRAKKLSQPRDASGRPIKPGPNAPQSGQSLVDAPSGQTVEPPKGQVRTVGPTFYPVR